jgi:Fe-S cluster assembly scaffold protein SufB
VSPCVSLQVPAGDNYYAALNCAVFSDGSFVYIPKGVKCPMELSTYFRINAQESGQVCACQDQRHNIIIQDVSGHGSASAAAGCLPMTAVAVLYCMALQLRLQTLALACF